MRKGTGLIKKNIGGNSVKKGENMLHQEQAAKSLAFAAEILAELGIPKTEYALGGGTVLSNIYNHRISKDIDIFIWNPQYFDRLSPQADFIDRPEITYYHRDAIFFQAQTSDGKIDFILAGQITDYKAKKTSFLGQDIYVEHPIEIVGKKLFYRGFEARPRDVFDLAVVADQYKNELLSEMRKFPNRLEEFSAKVFRNLHDQSDQYSVVYKNLLLPNGEKYIGREAELIANLLKELHPEKTQLNIIKPTGKGMDR